MEDRQDFNQAGESKAPLPFYERMITVKVKVMIVDGTVDAVLGDDETMQSSLQVEIIDFDRD